MTTKDEDSVVWCGNSSMLGTGHGLLISNSVLFVPSNIIWTHFHDEEFIVWQNLAIL
jgi:hypothetical protein